MTKVYDRRRVVVAVSLLLIPTALAFQSSVVNNRCRIHDAEIPLFMANNIDHGDDTEDTNEKIVNGRRSFISSAKFSFLAVLASQASTPLAAFAGIDVSGVRTEGGGAAKSGGSSTIADQLKGIDGSPTTRVQEIKSVQDQAAAVKAPKVPIDSTAASSVSRSSLSEVKLTREKLGTIYRCQDQLVGPEGSRSKFLDISFEFPSDWLQLDRVLGGIEYVDQRNGDKLYILRARLPADTTLSTVPKAFFGESIFDPQGSISRGGTVVDEYRVTSSVLSSQIVNCPGGACSSTRRRLGIKYATVTGNGYRVERRALADAYEVDGVVYMLVTSSNAVKFEAKGKERDTVEAIVDSFRLER